jgi:predicted small lipoprotein YifL
MGALVVSVALLNTACGLKAPLYLPDEKEQEVAPSDTGAGKRRVLPRPAPQAPKQDRIDAGKSQGVPAPTPPADPDRSAAPPPPPGT